MLWVKAKVSLNIKFFKIEPLVMLKNKVQKVDKSKIFIMSPKSFIKKVLSAYTKPTDHNWFDLNRIDNKFIAT